MSIRDIYFDGKERSVLIAGAQTKPFYALFNYFSLHNGGRMPKIEPHRILKILITRDFSRKEITQPDNANSGDFMQNNTLQPNPTGSPSSFTRRADEHQVDQELFSLCERLKIKLFHGCIDNPKDPNDVAQRGLTEHGLDALRKEIGEAEFALLYRNGYIDIVHKHSGSLLLLETEDHTVDKGNKATWRLLTMHESQEVLFSYSYDPLDLESQPNCKEAAVVEFISQWKAAKERVILEKLAELEEDEKKEKELKKNKGKEQARKEREKRKQMSAAKQKVSGSEHGECRSMLGHLRMMKQVMLKVQKFPPLAVLRIWMNSSGRKTSSRTFLKSLLIKMMTRRNQCHYMKEWYRDGRL